MLTLYHAVINPNLLANVLMLTLHHAVTYPNLQTNVLMLTLYHAVINPNLLEMRFYPIQTKGSWIIRFTTQFTIYQSKTLITRLIFSH